MTRRSSYTVLVALVIAAGCSRSIEGSGRRGGSDDLPPGSSVKVFDEQKMAQDIEQQSAKSGVPLRNVVCPPYEVVQKGRTFDCHAGSVTIHIVVTSDRGDYKWTPEPN